MTILLSHFFKNLLIFHHFEDYNFIASLIEVMSGPFYPSFWKISFQSSSEMAEISNANNFILQLGLRSL